MKVFGNDDFDFSIIEYVVDFQMSLFLNCLQFGVVLELLVVGWIQGEYKWVW